MLSVVCLPSDPNLLVGFETSDDAAVYRLAPDLAVISTADFITPPVDEPIWFGRIAAANALSDVYAMGGRPVMALNLVMFPSKKLDKDVLKEILRGGAEVVAEAGAALAGGHSVDDNEPKYGLAVTGTVHPDRVLTNCAARPGDALVLTKPLGSGVLFNARRSGKLSSADLAPVLPLVATLNRAALAVAQGHAVHACTDITGFGILGHAYEMARGSSVMITLRYDALPFYSDSLPMYQRGETTGSNDPNRRMVEGHWEQRRSLTRHQQELLFDPQTSGGLLLSLPAGEADELARRLRAAGVSHAAVVGDVSALPAGGLPGLIVV